MDNDKDIYPWNKPSLKGWDIVGMNHYYVNGERRLFVAMVKNGICIKAEGANESRVFQELIVESWKYNKKNEVPEINITSKVRVLFHEVWGHCKKSKEYNKDKWIDLQRLLGDL